MSSVCATTTPGPLHQRLRHGVVARQRGGVALGRLRAEGRLARLEGQDPLPLLAQPPRELDEARAVERLEALDVAGDDLDGVVRERRLEEVGDRQVHLVAVRDRRPREDDPVEVAA